LFGLPEYHKTLAVIFLFLIQDFDITVIIVIAKNIKILLK